MTPLAKAAYDEACEEQAAWADARGIKSNEDMARVTGAAKVTAADIVCYLYAIKERLAQAKQPERNAR
jgi:hypothetical protein